MFPRFRRNSSTKCVWSRVRRQNRHVSNTLCTLVPQLSHVSSVTWSDSAQTGHAESILFMAPSHHKPTDESINSIVSRIFDALYAGRASFLSTRTKEGPSRSTAGRPIYYLRSSASSADQK